MCQTVVRIDGAHATFDAMQETLRKTTIGAIAGARLVNVERSATTGDEIGGHALAGHVSGTAEIVDVSVHENNRVVTFRVPEAWMNYIFSQGFIALDGASLTIVAVDREQATFRVSFIPETLKRTTFGFKGTGDRVNVEIDSRTQIIVDTVERVPVGPLPLVLLHVAELIGPLRLDDLKAGDGQQAIDQPPAAPHERRVQESLAWDADEPGPILGPPQVGRPATQIGRAGGQLLFELGAGGIAREGDDRVRRARELLAHRGEQLGQGGAVGQDYLQRLAGRRQERPLDRPAVHQVGRASSRQPHPFGDALIIEAARAVVDAEPAAIGRGGFTAQDVDEER